MNKSYRILPDHSTQALNSEYVRACHASSDRSRVVIIGLILTSIFAFFCLWNSYRFSWAHERLALETDTLKWFDVFVVPCREDGSLLSPGAPSTVPGGGDQAQLEATTAKSTGQEEGLLGIFTSDFYALRFDANSRAAQAGTPQSRLRNIFEHLVSIKAHSLDVAYTQGVVMTKFEARALLALVEGKVSEFRRQIASKSLFPSIPILGVSFDVNDLGLLSGIAFVVLLSWLRFALVRESQNLTMAFDSARVLDRTLGSRELHRVYYTLSTRQVLTSPRFGHFENERFWDIVPQVLVALPAAIHGAIIFNDFRTLSIGLEISPQMAILSLIASFALFTAVVFLTTRCLVQWWENNALWSEAFDELANAKAVPAGAPPRLDRNDDERPFTLPSKAKGAEESTPEHHEELEKS